MKLFYLSIMLFALCHTPVSGQEEIKLYPNEPTENNGLTVDESYQRPDFLINISKPRMYYYPAPKEKANGTAVLICPGGGYAGVSILNEGEKEAKWFNQIGVTAFVLYYRMPNEHTTIPLTDAQTALEIIYKRAKEWKINKKKVGIMGFSAGGHLASTVGTHFTTDTQRPAFMILGYPVISMKNELTHKGSRNNLLGKNPTDSIINQYSNELQVTTKTPPTFLFHAADDKGVKVANSELFQKALEEQHVPVEFHKFDVGGHGFGMTKKGIDADNWPELLQAWLKASKLIDK